MTDQDAYTVTPEAWEELFAMFKPLIVGVASWGENHELPLSMVVGAVIGVAEVIHRAGNGCDCAICDAIMDAMGEEVVDRMLEPMTAVLH